MGNYYRIESFTKISSFETLRISLQIFSTQIHWFHLKMRVLAMELCKCKCCRCSLDLWYVAWIFISSWPLATEGKTVFLYWNRNSNPLSTALCWSFLFAALDYLSSMYWWHPEMAILQICQMADIVWIPHNLIRIALQGTTSEIWVLLSQLYAMTSQHSIFHKISLLTSHWIIHVPDNVADLTQQS